jgi:hypothetical protein
MNPEKMRSEYGKLCYLLQDSQIKEVKEGLGFTLCKLSVKTVYEKAEDMKIEKIFDDDLILISTMEIIDDKKKSRFEINK